ncbi:MAG: hypothetical protein CMN00_04875 [Rickettsiales bacterium]|jgi:hypothetical protein|nr:hypothetical protein [Rickettsiales bacterium]|tara:strand:- start:385 stop:747 length:363 start_codon:yes stop_codon:yes gene_type:complete
MPEDFTPAQLARQVEKIRQALFDDFEDMGEGKYSGELNIEVKKIIEGTLIFDKVLSEDEFTVMFSDCTDKLLEWIQEQTKGVDTRIAAFFIQDFIAQTLSNAYDVKEVEHKDNGSDPMFG